MENFSGDPNASKCHIQDSAARMRAFIFFYLLIILASLPLNTFSLYVSWQHIRRKNELGVYLFHLALSDLTFTAGLILWLDFLWRGFWAHGDLSCVLSIYCLFTNFYTSDALLCCIAFDRYIAVVHPFRCRFLRKVSAAFGMSSAVWVLVLLFNAVTIFTEDNLRGDPILCFDILQPLTANMARANVLRFTLGFAIPVLAVSFLAWGIFKVVRKNQATPEQEVKRVGKLLLAIWLCLVVCMGPVHALMLVRTLVRDCESVQWLLYPHKISVAVSCLNCLCDPLLYCFITRTGKEELQRAAAYVRGRTRSAESGEAVSVGLQCG
ncbi:unnamed protein product [Knipowitschia caucasica]|uniref:G-protein coupled receptors family 1 profile domain-containing protein n=1 Tax=Knipowitschia caucasica TaxID=637954 RepID=A0AAV2JJR2_KNICA